MNVLVVDDDQASRKLAEITLRDAGFSVTAARDCAEALALIRHSKPEAILLDMEFPTGLGTALMDDLRALGLADEITVIAMSAYAEEFRDKAIESGCCDLIPKPVNIRDLARRLLDAVAKRKTKQE